MRVSQLKITTFRNLTALRIDVSMRDGGQIVALVGENGAGKTSVLEALSLLSPGRGLHKAKAEDMVQHGTKSWGVYVELDGEDGVTVGQAFQSKARLIKIDGDDAAKQSHLAALGNVLWLTPRQDRLFLDGAAVRRDFLDRLVYGLIPNHAETLNKFKHHARARLQLLKQGAAGDWVALEEQQAAEAGVEVLKNRQRYIEKIQPFVQEVTLSLSGATMGIFEEEDSVAALAGKFERSRMRDAEVGATHTGPQKVDLAGTLQLEHGDVPLGQCSSGQHKRGLMQVVLGHARLLQDVSGNPPLVLMDEVAAHLDAEKRSLMLQELVTLGAQIWVTETEVERLGDVQRLPLEVILLERGALVDDA